MFLHFLSFEIRNRLRRISTYVYFMIWFLLTFFSVSATNFGPVGAGAVLLNGPYALAVFLVQFTTFGTLVISALFGTSILRDFQQNTYPLIFTKPISKFDYLGGRWAGSLIVSLAVFLGLLAGAACGTIAPWTDKTRIAPAHLWFYVQPFLNITAVQIFFLGSLFFMVAALTRRLVVVYLQGVVLFTLYLIGAIMVLNGNSRSLDNTFWPSLLDPLGLVMFDTTTRYWSVVEKNTQTLTLTGVFLYNRLLWSGVGLLSLIASYTFFPLSAEQLTARRRWGKLQPPGADDESPVRYSARLVLPSVAQTFGRRAIAAQLRSLTRLRFLNIVREIPFWGIALIMVVLTLLNAREAGRFEDSAVWPVTYLMTEVVSGSSALFLYIVATLYAGELVWRERDVHFNEIHDALPVPSWIDWLSRFLSLVLLELVLLTIVMLCGIGSQAFRGYFHFELPVYFKELYLIDFAGILTFILIALFVQTMVSNKFVGHAIVIGANLLVPILYRYGFENRLYLPGEIAPYTYSDMNGYGHFIAALFWSNVYWFSFAAFLAVLTIVLARRGTDAGLGRRWKQTGPKLPALLAGAAACLLVMAASGGWYYYNGHVLNEFRTEERGRQLAASYERSYKKYERLPQPKITAVDATVEVYPERRSLEGRGAYTLVNHTSQPISEIHLTDSKESVHDVRFDRPFRNTLDDRALHYSIYRLDTPLQPGESLRTDFRVSWFSHGFRDGSERPELAYNGTFFDRDYFPSIGYNAGMEIDNPVRRREQKLPPLEEMAPPGDPYYSNINLFTADSEWITYHCVVGTSPDQVAVAPGYLKREWTENGRHYFEYDMGGTRINDFFSFISGRYAVRRDDWKGVKLEIYYNLGHEYNLNRMLESSKKGLNYFTANFGPYQFRQFRVLEFPRYRTFAQSFPNTVPYSEALGFIQRVEKPDDIDEVFYITAHELAHQWWGHQLIGSQTKGSNMMSETLAQYSALMIMEKQYGAANMRKFLRHELDSYLRGRSGEVRKEPPLALVEREPYVWYNKGSLVMYALRDYIGEDRVNAALRSFLEKNRFAQGPYPDTRGFVASLREVTPPEMQYLIGDLFESIVLFDNKAVTATYSPAPGGKYKVALTVNAAKKKADGSGVETDIPLNDLIDIGVFTGPKEKERPLYFAKHRLNQRSTTITLTVDELPQRAGIDPYNKLIDRNPDDNVISVTKTSP
jgi:hypothetical protein